MDARRFRIARVIAARMHSASYEPIGFWARCVFLCAPFSRVPRKYPQRRAPAALGAGSWKWRWAAFVPLQPAAYLLSAEIWYLLGCQTTTAYNLACVVIIVASAVFMRLLGQLYFGRAGGWLAAAAYIYSPHFHVDLYVRQALAEFAAFPFYPLTLYGFGRFARDRDRWFLLLGAIGLACVFLAHNAAALLFAPILSAFILYNAWSGRSLKLMLQLFGGAVLGLALSAFVWLPILMEMKDVHIDRFIEGYLNYSNHMVYVQQFFSTTWGFGLSWPGYGDGLSFS